MLTTYCITVPILTHCTVDIGFSVESTFILHAVQGGIWLDWYPINGNVNANPCSFLFLSIHAYVCLWYWLEVWTKIELVMILLFTLIFPFIMMPLPLPLLLLLSVACPSPRRHAIQLFVRTQSLSKKGCILNELIIFFRCGASITARQHGNKSLCKGSSGAAFLLLSRAGCLHTWISRAVQISLPV